MMRGLYSLKVLAWIGACTLVASVVLLVAGWLFIPDFVPQGIDGQMYMIRHADLRDNDTLYTNLFLKSIKENKGYLVVGTSETTFIKNGNYHEFLNADSTLNCKFSVVAGAGRTAFSYFPLLLSNPNAQGLKMIYFINPIYWRYRYAESSLDYFYRYVSFAQYYLSNRPKNDLVDKILKKNLLNERPLAVAGDFLELFVNKGRKKFSRDIDYYRNPNLFYSNISLVGKKTFGPFEHYGEIDSANYNFDYNVLKSFDVGIVSLFIDTVSQYRYDELQAMSQICKQKGVDITFIVGPYNGILFEKTYPDQLPKLDSVVCRIKRVLDQNEMAYIDASGFSYTSGFFSDAQHHSHYGAYLLYKEIKDYVLEKEKR
ncbi:MAG: hypothetical protein HUK15_06040 [Bacteroidales bacterium]|nr:hypothetical protein [Bacteroidales bacterium]